MAKKVKVKTKVIRNSRGRAKRLITDVSALVTEINEAVDEVQTQADDIQIDVDTHTHI